MKYLFFSIAALWSLQPQSTQAQFVGAIIQTGIYSPSYTDPSDVKQKVTGKGFLSLGAMYETKFGNSGKIIVPVSLSYSRFGSEQNFGQNKIMTQDANAVSLGGGIKYFMKDDHTILRPFMGLILNYEALINSTYYYDAQQSGNLDWNSNLYAQIQVGLGIETIYTTRLDVYTFFSPGLLNRVDKKVYGIYRDQIVGLGVNILFN